MGGNLHSDDSDIDVLLGATIAKVGESQSVVEASIRLQAMIDAARGVPLELVDPKDLRVRFTRLHACALSAAHYLHACQDDFEETVALRMGAAFHAALFENRKVVCYDGRRQGKDWTRFEKHFTAQNAVILNKPEYATAIGMIGAIRRHPRAMELLFDGTTRERTIEWDRGGRACRSTPDAYSKSRSVELKSARSTEPRWFKREALRRNYHAQLAFYDDAIESELAVRPPDSYIIACENVDPFNVVVLRLPAETRLAGVKLCRSWWERLRAAETLNYYGGYVENDIDLDLPDYELAEEVVEIDGRLVTTD